MYCPKCGTQLSDDAKFCPSCGAAVAGTSDLQSTEQGGYAQPHARREFNKYLLLACAAAVILVFFLAGSARSSFSIVGTWRSVGDAHYGVTHKGAVVVFSDSSVNLLSQFDVYSLEKNGSSYTLYLSPLMGSFTTEFDVTIKNKNNIVLTDEDGTTLELERS